MRRGILRCPRCALWRPWSSSKPRPKIDRHCIKCGHRIRVQLDRKGRGKSSSLHSEGRGRKRQVQVKELPGNLAPRVLVKIMREHNRFEARGGRRSWQLQGGSEKTFVPASSLDPGANIRTVGLARWDAISETLEREVGESENEV